MRPIRLALLTGRLKHGGAELQMIALTRELRNRGFRVDIVARSGDGPLDAQAQAAGARVRAIGQRALPGASAAERYSRRLDKHLSWLRLARRERYDVVDAWLHPTDVFAALTRPLTGIPVVAAARIDRLPRWRMGVATRPLYASVNRLTDVVVACADITAADAVRLQRVPADKVRVIRGGVTLPRAFSPDQRRAQRIALQATDADFVIGCVGNFRTMKRHDLLLVAFARILPAYPHLRLVLVGDGDLRPKIEEQIEHLGIGHRVFLTGSATDLPPLYDAFDLFVQASNSEGLPNVLLEAAASRLPIVATAAGGSGEVVRDGETGLLVPIDDEGRLAAALDLSIRDAELRARLSTAARALIEREYGMERFGREYAELYQELLEAKGAMPS